jgi:hypothetical protein
MQNVHGTHLIFPNIPITTDTSRTTINTEQRCIKSCLHGPKAIRTYINDLVVATSELESRASLVYTLALLRCSEQEGIVPVEMFSQIFMTRCLGVVRSSEAQTRFRPSEICQRYLTDALQHVPPISDYDFTYFGQLYNQLGRRMHTMIMTSLCRHMNSRRSKAIRASVLEAFPKLSKSVCSFVTKELLWRLSGAPVTSCHALTLQGPPGTERRCSTLGRSQNYSSDHCPHHPLQSPGSR